VAPVLELANDLEGDGVAERDVGSRRVHAELDAERLLGRGGALELLAEVGLGDDALGSAGEGFDLVVDGHVARDFRDALGIAN
jgi:hypothetical protein